MTLEDIALQMTPGIGVKGAVHLLEHFGSAARIFAASADELTEGAGLRPDIARQLLQRKAFAAAEREIAYCRRHGIAVVASTDSGYPPLLRETPDYPAVLYIKGNAEALTARCLTLVGTRRATPYGQAMCDRLVGELAERVPGLCVVSGLAFGIDIAAHRAALTAGIPTVAVLANALPEVTPAQHTAIARDIVEHGGALVTELHSQTRQNGSFYVARNRIIAALSAGCIVVESPDSGGSLLTAADNGKFSFRRGENWIFLREEGTRHSSVVGFSLSDEGGLAVENAYLVGPFAPDKKMTGDFAHYKTVAGEAIGTAEKESIFQNAARGCLDKIPERFLVDLTNCLIPENVFLQCYREPAEPCFGVQERQYLSERLTAGNSAALQTGQI